MPNTIPLTDGKHFAIVDPEDYERIAQHKWEYQLNEGIEYASRRFQINKKRTCILMHREVMGCVAGDGIIIDHASGVGLDNRKSNLRVADKSQQMWNTKLSRKNKSGVKGVCWYPQKNRWQTWIMVRGKRKSLGNYKDFDEAVTVRRATEKEHYGEFARLPEYLKPNHST